MTGPSGLQCSITLAKVRPTSIAQLVAGDVDQAVLLNALRRVTVRTLRTGVGQIGPVVFAGSAARGSLDLQWLW